MNCPHTEPMICASCHDAAIARERQAIVDVLRIAKSVAITSAGRGALSLAIALVERRVSAENAPEIADLVSDAPDVDAVAGVV